MVVICHINLVDLLPTPLIFIFLVATTHFLFYLGLQRVKENTLSLFRAEASSLMILQKKKVLGKENGNEKKVGEGENREMKERGSKNYFTTFFPGSSVDLKNAPMGL